MAAKLEPAFRDAVLSTRDGYAAACELEKFQLEAYSGTGGFCGSVRQSPSSFWGWAADAYVRFPIVQYSDTGAEEAQIDTYLDRFKREDLPKFKRRVAIAHYPNHVEPCVNVPLSYMRRKPVTTEGVESIAEWSRDVDGCGTPWRRFVDEVVIPRAAVVGMCPVVFDIPPSDDPTAERTRAQDLEEGRRVRMTALFPAHVLDWHCDDHGEFEWVKIRTDRCERPNALEPAKRYVDVRIYGRREIRTISLLCLCDDKGCPTGEYELDSDTTATHPWADLDGGEGQVPVTFLRLKPMPGEHVKGISLIQCIGFAAKRLFNLVSELDEHIRSCVFAMLQVPAKNHAAASKMLAGNDQAVVIDPDSKQPFAWIGPPADVAATLEKRIEVVTNDIYRMARLAMQQGNPVATTAASGVSRAYDFEGTNRAIADMAQQTAAWEQDAYELVMHVESTDDLAKTVRVTPATSFDVEEFGRDLEEAKAVIDLGVGSTATAELLKRVVRRALPNLADDLLTTIDNEIEDGVQAAADAEARASQAMAEAATGAPSANGAAGDKAKQVQQDVEAAANPPPGMRGKASMVNSDPGPGGA